MAAAPPVPAGMELAEFFAKLVLDAFEGVREAMRLQEERLAEISAAASLGPAEFARAAVSDEEVEDELARLFPSADARRPHAIFEGAAYQPAPEGVAAESPPVHSLLGLRLERADFTTARGTNRSSLNKSGVEKIRGAVRLRRGAEAQSVLRRSLARGVPQLVVDSGKISAALSLSLEAPPGARTTAAPLRRPEALLLVRTVDDHAPQNQKLRVDIVSRLEVTFKTVT